MNNCGVLLPYTLADPIRTGRLALRLHVASDVDEVHAYQSDSEVTRYQRYEPRSAQVLTEKLAEWGAATVLENNDDYLQLAIDPENPVIGPLYCVLKRVEDGAAEIGWAPHRDYQGKGYAFEAASAVLDLAFATPLGCIVLLASWTRGTTHPSRCACGSACATKHTSSKT